MCKDHVATLSTSSQPAGKPTPTSQSPVSVTPVSVTPVSVTVSLASSSDQPRILGNSLTMLPPQGPVTYQPPPTPVLGIQPSMLDVERRGSSGDNRVANVQPLKSSPRHIPTGKMEPNFVSSLQHSTAATSSQAIMFCYPENLDMNGAPRLPMETPPRRLSSVDLQTPSGGIFPVSPFHTTNNVFTSPSNTGPIHRQHQSYYIDGTSPSIGNSSINQHAPPPPPPPYQQANTYFSPVPANPTGSIQSDPYAQSVNQYQHPPPPVQMQPASGNMSPYHQYPMQPTHPTTQWAPGGYQYGSPVKTSGIQQYGQSPPTATYITSTAPLTSPYMPASQ